MRFAPRMSSIQLSGIRKMFEMAGEGAVHLGLGEPDFNPPQEAIDAVCRAMREGKNSYQSTFGIKPLREAVAERLRRYWNEITWERVVITQSGSEALFSAIFSVVGEGDEVLLPDPGFVLYAPQVTLSGGRPVFYHLKKENSFRPDLGEMETLITDRTKAIVLNYPNNPTGGVIDEAVAEEIVDLARRHGLFIISDEVYDRIIYSRQHVSFLGRYERTILVNSFSKTLAMTGWRLGYMAGEKEIMERVALAHYHVLACPSTPLQYGALAAMGGEDDFVEMMMERFRRRREMVIEGLKRIPGFSLHPPGGAFYAFPSVNLVKDGKRLSSEEVAMELLKGGVITVPGSAFGEAGEGFLRLSFATSEDLLEEGLKRISSVVEELDR